jgi:hypothetical protein
MTNAVPPLPDHPPKPATKRRLGLIAAAVTAVALAIGVTVHWLNQPSYNDIVNACGKALVAQVKAGGQGKPSACDGVKKDDYDTLVFGSAIDGLGWTDKDGNFDVNKMLESTP